MNRAAWVAVIAAIAFPSIALVVVLVVRPQPPGPPLPPHALHPFDPGGPLKGPPRPMGGPPSPLEDELLRLRKQLELTDAQVEKIWSITEPTRREASELRYAIAEKETELHRVLSSDDVAERDAVRCLDELHRLRLRMDTIKVVTPLRLKKVLTAEQQERLTAIWRDEGKAPPTGPRPPGPQGVFHPLPPGPPGPPGPPFAGPHEPPPPGFPGPFAPVPSAVDDAPHDRGIDGGR